jgi:hypothetical protein
MFKRRRPVFAIEREAAPALKRTALKPLLSRTTALMRYASGALRAARGSATSGLPNW